MTPRSLSEIRARARMELRINPTITTYVMADTNEFRRYANPYTAFNDAIQAFDQLTLITMRLQGCAPLTDLGEQR